LQKADTTVAGPDHGTVLTFTSNNPHVSLPDRRYLALHAACAKVMRAAGMAEAIDKLYDNWETTRVLSGDGASLPLLHDILSTIAVC